ncbi:MAG: preprotein translocase subunit SecA [Gammaproteobacteria bacterium]|nr:preprotein translocase subunit SecA [Gammaproteobacteria bacterium]
MSATASLLAIPAAGAYPQRELERVGWLDQQGHNIYGAIKRRLQRRDAAFARVTEGVSSHRETFAALDEEGLRTAAADMRARLHREGIENEALVFECFALVRELAGRVLGKPHYDVQIFGGWVLLNGSVAEMNTGEGKTLTATLAVATAALAGLPTHVVTVNDYLVERDAEELGPLYRALGLTVGTVLSGMSPPERRAAYACDVTYVTNKELVFDFLKDRIALAESAGAARLQLERAFDSGSRSSRMLLRGLHFAVVDEIDSVLIDEARVPVIISRSVENPEQTDFYHAAIALAAELEAGRDYLVDLRERHVKLTEGGRQKIDEYAAQAGGIWKLRQFREAGMVQALCAHRLYIRDLHYLVQDDKVMIVDEFTGRTMADRSWEMGLHQMVEAKEGVTITGEREALAKISYQRFFSRYIRLAGMSGTLREIAPELWNVYKLTTITVPTNKPSLREHLPDRVYATKDRKWAAVIERINELHAKGQPLLIGTRSVAASEELSARLTEVGLPHTVLNARQDEGEADIVKLAGHHGHITVATNMAGRGTDIAPDDEALAAGGLYVIATERHEAGRIDRQLFGRAARQGDPGACECILSLEDELIVEHAPAVIRRLASRLIPGEGALPARLGRWVFSLTQRRVERQHSRIRADLLELDQRRSDMLAFSGAQE